MAIQTIGQGSPSQQASAEQHLSRRDEWRSVRVNGTRYVVLPSATSGKVYTVRADGRGCSCPAYTRGLAVCSHMLSVRMDIEQAREQATRPRYEDLMNSHLVDAF